MKSKILLALSAFVCLLATSCNVSETITFNEDGSGVMTLEMDAEQLMALAGGQMGGEKRVDSVFSFKEIFKQKADSIAQLPKEEQERLKKLENLDVRMLMDSETGEFKMTFTNKFKKPEELINMMSGLADATGSRSKMKDAPIPGLDEKNPPISYYYDGKKFKKTIMATEKPEGTENDSLQMAMEQINQAFEGSTYTVKYNFPKKIKSVNNKSAVISADKKTVTVVYDFIDYLDKPKEMNLEVVFE